MQLFFKMFGYSLITKQTQVAELMLGQLWDNIYDVTYVFSTSCVAGKSAKFIHPGQCESDYYTASCVCTH